MDAEAKKKKILWISVVIISTTIFLFWVYGLSYTTQNILNNKQADPLVDIPEIKKDFNNINEELTKMQATIDNAIKEKAPPDQDATAIKKEIEEKLRTQLEQSTSTNIHTPVPESRSN